ncbi:uncharacterized protein At4g19900 isoform X1 [Nymphaea colorata]|nr:uncharacterized protein At4g19900 isoform X1 [Nymphaea colorata]
MLRKIGGRVAGRPKLNKSTVPPSRKRWITNVCAISAAALLLLSLFLLHARLSTEGANLKPGHRFRDPAVGDAEGEALLQDQKKPDDIPGDDSQDRIDESDEPDEKEAFDRADPSDLRSASGDRKEGSGYFWDHAVGVFRRAFTKGGAMDDEWSGRLFGISAADDRIKLAFGSDDQPLDKDIRAQVSGIRRIEDALLLNKKKKSGSTPMDWTAWSDKLQRQSSRGYFPLRDPLFRSTMEALNPLNHPLLQDPDSAGVTGLTRSDRIVKKSLLNQINENPRRVERRKTLEEGRYANGRRWGYFPGMKPNLGFSEFMDQFFRRGKCSMRFFMIWNTPSWSYTVRHQRGLESILYYHPDACVVMLTETMELDFFQNFVKDGYKVATAMPNLDELLMDTPTHMFASIWHKWRKVPLYHIHYSELVRLAVLYKYGGIYVDSDVVVLKPLKSLDSSVGLEHLQNELPSLNGAVMAFRHHSHFILECLKEFFSTYDDKLLRWNGAELVSRTAARIVNRSDYGDQQLHIKIEPTSKFFPISSDDITRYFEAPDDEDEIINLEVLFQKIINESYAFHFWHGLTSTLVPHTGSLVEKVLNHHCLRCHDVL